MLNQLRSGIVGIGLLLAVSASSQKIPIFEPHLLPFPAVSGGLSYYSIVPTQNMLLASSPSGWTVADTLRGIAINLDLEYLRYRWGDLVLKSPRYDAYSSLGFSIFSQIGSFSLPSNYPSSFAVGATTLSGFEFSFLVKEFYLDNRFIYNYSHRGELHGNLGLGLSSLNLYKNGNGDRLIKSNGLAFHFGLGWKTTLFGRPGERIRFGVDLGYTLRSFDIGEQDQAIQVSGGSAGSLSPIQSLSINTPELKFTLELGERLYAAHTPFREPYRLGLFNLSSGFGMINLRDGSTIQYDSTGNTLSLSAIARISQNYDLQIFKYNWPFLFIKQANIDAFSGMGIRYWRNSKQTSVPSGWASKISKGGSTYTGMTFSPRVTDYYVDHEIIYPLSNRFHATVNAGNGFAKMTLYENIKKQNLIKSSSLTWHIGGGLGFTFQGDGSSMVVIGLSATYYHQAFDFDLGNSDISAVNPQEIIPINHLDLSQGIISLDIGLIFGGKTNTAQEAHQAFVDKDFTKSLEIQTGLLNSFPDHYNKAALMLEKKMIEDTLVTQYYREAHDVLAEGKIKSAYSLLNRGKTPPTPGVKKAISGMKVSISDKALESAATALKILDYKQAEEMILLALKSDPSCLPVAKVLLSRSYIIRATILYESKTYGRALYWLKQAEGITDRYKLVIEDMREKIGEGRLDDANEGILREDKEMVYQSMQDAKELKPILSDVVDEHLKNLEKAIEYESDEKITSLKRMALDNLLDEISELDPKNFVPSVGMQGSVLANYVGEPDRRFKEGEYELWTYPRDNGVELWLYLRDGIIEKVEFK